MQIGRARGNRLQTGPEGQRQAGKRALEVCLRQGIAFGDHRGRAGKAAHEFAERLFHFQNDPGATFRDQRYVAAELNGVAKSLFAVQQNRLSGDSFISEPERLRKMTLGDSRGWRPAAPLIFDPPMFEVAGDEIRQALEEMRVGMVRAQRHRAVVTRRSLVEPLQIVQRDAAIGQGLEMIGFDRKRAIITRERLVEPPKLVQRDAAIAERGGIARSHGDRMLVIASASPYRSRSCNATPRLVSASTLSGSRPSARS